MATGSAWAPCRSERGALFRTHCARRPFARLARDRIDEPSHRVELELDLANLESVPACADRLPLDGASPMPERWPHGSATEPMGFEDVVPDFSPGVAG
jgi:hypothetical protein